MIRIAVLSDRSLIGSAVAALLREEPAFRVLAEEGQEEWRRLPSSDDIDVVVLVSSLMGALLERLIGEVRRSTRSKLLFISTQNDQDSLLCAFRAGADGAFDFSVDREFLVQSLREVAQGDVVIPRSAASLLVREYAAGAPRGPGTGPLRVLTPREMGILSLISRGESNKAIASQLAISEHTVRAHVRTIMSKLEVGNRVQAAVIALRTGLAAS